jgi:hypothetical protein
MVVGVGTRVQTTNLDRNLANVRLIIPVALTIAIAYGNYVTGDSNLKVFQMLSKEQFLGAMFGFLSYFYSIIFFEVGKELKSEDLLGFLPGSITEALRLSKSSAKNPSMEKVSSCAFMFF